MGVSARHDGCETESMCFRRIVACLAFLAMFVVVSRASADESGVSAYFDTGIGMRVISYRGLTLRPGGGTGMSTLSVRGEDVNPAIAGNMMLGGGLRVGPIVGGVDINL